MELFLEWVLGFFACTEAIGYMQVTASKPRQTATPQAQPYTQPQTAPTQTRKRAAFTGIYDKVSGVVEW